MAATKRVWVVDDSVMALDAAVRQLEDDYEVEPFRDGSAVIERAASDVLPDVLVLDWLMPGVSGAEVLDFLRAAPRTQTLPILVLTATASEADLVEALDAGADDYVAKPCSRAALVARVGSLVRAKDLRERTASAEREIASLLERERAARADAETANDVKDAFLATLSHELRTPLNSILGWTSLLRAGTLPATSATRALETIERNAKAQAAIIEDLLDISRIVSGKLRLDTVDVDPADVTAQAIETVRPLAANKKVELRTAIDPVGLVSGDPARLQQIVWNLLSNAIRFTPAGGTVSVALEAARDGVLLSVTDTGEGIDAALLPSVFDRFRQGDSSSTRSHSGLGLGLAIVRHLTDLHGGQVRASSDGRGHGARFEVWLPLLRRTEAGAPDPFALTPARLRGCRVLVVDDDDDSRELLHTALERQGADVTAASSAEQALERLDVALPHLLISDIMMPGTDGYALIRSVRARPIANGGGMPAIALTAAVREEDRARALAAGFQHHLGKPVDLPALFDVVVRLVDDRSRGHRKPLESERERVE